MRGVQWACLFVVVATLALASGGCRSPGDLDVPHDDPIYQNRNDVYPNRD